MHTSIPGHTLVQYWEYAGPCSSRLRGMHTRYSSTPLLVEEVVQVPVLQCIPSTVDED